MSESAGAAYLGFGSAARHRMCPADFSVTVRLDPKIRRAIADIDKGRDRGRPTPATRGSLPNPQSRGTYRVWPCRRADGANLQRHSADDPARRPGPDRHMFGAVGALRP